MNRILTIAAAAVAISGIGASAAAACTKPPAKPTMSDKGWTVVPGSLLVHKDYGGDFDGTARITNRTGSTQSASFTFTVFRGSRQLGTLLGIVTAVGRGRTVTVQLISTDNYATPGRYAFQTNWSF